jgi:hypothetical protein
MRRGAQHQLQQYADDLKLRRSSPPAIPQAAARGHGAARGGVLALGVANGGRAIIGGLASARTTRWCRGGDVVWMCFCFSRVRLDHHLQQQRRRQTKCGK